MLRNRQAVIAVMKVHTHVCYLGFFNVTHLFIKILFVFWTILSLWNVNTRFVSRSDLNSSSGIIPFDIRTARQRRFSDFDSPSAHTTSCGRKCGSSAQPHSQKWSTWAAKKLWWVVVNRAQDYTSPKTLVQVN